MTCSVGAGGAWPGTAAKAQDAQAINLQYLHPSSVVPGTMRIATGIAQHMPAALVRSMGPGFLQTVCAQLPPGTAERMTPDQIADAVKRASAIADAAAAAAAAATESPPQKPPPGIPASAIAAVARGALPRMHPSAAHASCGTAGSNARQGAPPAKLVVPADASSPAEPRLRLVMTSVCATLPTQC